MTCNHNCGYQTPNSKNMARHIQTHHNGQDGVTRVKKEFRGYKTTVRKKK